MKPRINYRHIGTNRKAFCAWYNTPIGRMLRDSEAKFLSRSITVSYTQRIIQLGWLGWESLFIDESLFRNFGVVDRRLGGELHDRMIFANIQRLPIASSSVDLVIMPHTLEFESNQHQVLREVERVLVAEGQLLLLGFNPWSGYRAYHYLFGRWNQAPWCGRFVGRQRVRDWLGLLNFETEVCAGFYLKSASAVSDVFEHRVSALFSIAYAIKAVKRRYTLIPLKPARSRLIPVEAVETA